MQHPEESSLITQTNIMNRAGFIGISTAAGTMFNQNTFNNNSFESIPND